MQKETEGYIYTNYVYEGDLLVAEIQNYYTMIFLYDGMGQPIGMLYKSTGSSTGEWQIFWYEKNLQGDVVAVYDNNGVKQVSYTYDAWGNCTTTTHVSGTAATYNPIRYRSYYYDREINLYYLGVRWYSTQFRRFLSPDDVSYLGANGDLNSYNLYAYCRSTELIRRAISHC